jgi:hypothetical protein
MNKTSSRAYDDCPEVNRRKRHISNNTSQTAKKRDKPHPTAPALQLQSEGMLTRNVLAPFGTHDEATETVDEKTHYQNGMLHGNEGSRHQ